MDFTTRRQFLVYLGMGTYSLLRSSSGMASAAFPLARSKASNGRFKPIPSSVSDELILAPGFRFDRIASYGDSLGSFGPFGAEHFGYDNDFTAYFPIDALSGGKKSDHGLLWVNHEFVSPFFLHGVAGNAARSVDRIRQEQLAVGGSVLEVKRKNGKWSSVVGSSFARRFTALYPRFQVTGPATGRLGELSGTLANCSGGRTFWNTALSGEENFQLFNPAQSDSLNWAQHSQTKIQEEHFGWIVEIDPFGELPPKKHTSLGRFCHENASLRLGESGRLAVYMGDDSADQYFYKYLSREKYLPSASRAVSSALLENGVLYVADFRKGQWVPLDLQANPALKSAGFKSQAEVLLRTRDAAKAVGATPLDRPEDCEVHPRDGSVYLSLTNNAGHGDFHGKIIRLVEKDDNAESLEFRYEIFLAGGPQSGLSCPDNLVFDSKGNLWVTCDVPGYAIGKGAYSQVGNNGMFMIPTSGRSMGDAFQFASGPVGAELTGPGFNESQDTLFLSVQHPGEGSTDRAHPTSHWPRGKDLPLPSVVAITGF